MMKKVEIEIPDGKKVEWVNGVLTLVDDTPKDIKERVKTFEDACSELGYEHQYVKEYREWMRIGHYECKDVMAYLKLRIITAALNEGWKPTFNKDERLHYPWFSFYSKDEWDKLDDDIKGEYRGPLKSVNNAYAVGGLTYEGSYYSTYDSVRLAFKTKELAEYCGNQFIDIWADLLFA